MSSTPPKLAVENQTTDQLPSTGPTLEPKPTSLRFSLSDGLLVASATASAYLWTFQYERGFALHFGIPSSFINIGLANVLFLAGLVIAVFFFGIMLLNSLVTIFFPAINQHPLLMRHATTLLIVLTPPYLLAFVYGTKVWLVLALAFTLILVFLLFVRPLLRHEETYLKKLEAQAAAYQKAFSGSIFKLASRRLGPNLPLAIWLFIYSFLIAQYAGDAAALNQKEFLVTTLDGSQEMVLLRSYGDELVFAPFNRTNKEVEKSFVIITIQELKARLTLEEAGPLSPVNSKNNKTLPMPSPLPTGSVTPSPSVTLKNLSATSK